MLDREKDGIYTTKVNGTTVGALTRRQQIDAVDCPVCSAPRGAACTGEGVRNEASHRERRALAMKLYGILPPQAVLPNRYVDRWYRKFREHIGTQAPRRKRSRPTRTTTPITTRYECPICGGPHSRADHVDTGLRAVVAQRQQERAA
jgi:hypothetical protein